MKKRKVIKISALLITMLVMSLVSVTAISAVSVSDKTRHKEVSTDELNVGDIVAEGLLGTDNTCDLGTLKVHTKAPGNGKTQWVGIKVNPKCQAVVNAKWHGSLKEGPRDVIEPLLRANPNETPLVSERLQPTLISNKASVVGITALSKTSSQHIYMYGFGGPIDKLTPIRSVNPHRAPDTETVNRLDRSRLPLRIQHAILVQYRSRIAPRGCRFAGLASHHQTWLNFYI